MSLWSGCCSFQSFHSTCSLDVLWSYHPIPDNGQILAIMAVPAGSVHTHPCGDGIHGAPVSPLRPLVTAQIKWLHSSGLVIKCKPDEFAMFNPPAGQNCSSWAQPFVDAAGGYIDNLAATSACRYCQYAVGDQFFVPLNISFSERWRDVFILFAYFSELLYEL